MPSDADRAVLSIALASCPMSDEPVGTSSEVEAEGWVIVDADAAKAESAEEDKTQVRYARLCPRLGRRYSRSLSI